MLSCFSHVRLLATPWTRSMADYILVDSSKMLAETARTLCGTRLLCPWDSPDKNTGVGWYSLLRDLPNPGFKPGSPALQVDSSLSHQGNLFYKAILTQRSVIWFSLRLSSIWFNRCCRQVPAVKNQGGPTHESPEYSHSSVQAASLRLFFLLLCPSYRPLQPLLLVQTVRNLHSPAQVLHLSDTALGVSSDPCFELQSRGFDNSASISQPACGHWDFPKVRIWLLECPTHPGWVATDPKAEGSGGSRWGCFKWRPTSWKCSITFPLSLSTSSFLVFFFFFNSLFPSSPSSFF